MRVPKSHGNPLIPAERHQTPPHASRGKADRQISVPLYVRSTFKKKSFQLGWSLF